ncbi:MAG TPA: glycogen synthase GlgA [Clostridiaceae bacterium]|jgi:starch synthase|nr:glycogen synthase GlgA [Clostridiaceae bacterium]
MEKIKVWLASSEVEPFIKTGGLADVAGSLPKALKALDVDIRVVLPKYGKIDTKYVSKMEFIGSCQVDLSWRKQYCGIFKLDYDGITYYFIDNEYYFFRNGIYGLYDDGERFSFFCKAILEVLPVIGFKPDIIHLNDWQTGMVSLLLDAHYRDIEGGFYRDIHTLFTIHNLKYQGVFPKNVLSDLLGLDWKYFNVDGVEYYDNINFLKAGLSYSSIISTVSHTYAEEIKYDFYGEGLQDLIKRRSNDLYGIVNGIDYRINNPKTDKRLYVNYDQDDLSGKYVNKQKIQQELGLETNPDVPLISLISRLVDQKGLDLIKHMLWELIDLGIQFVVLGTGEKKYEDFFLYAQSQLPGKVSANIKYDGVLAQRLYAASDMYLMPSLYEPCGLSQLFSMRYGTVPVVRETGGLKDTVKPYNVFTKEGTGFTFANYNAHEMKDAVARAIEIYRNKDEWEKLIRRCMNQDFSWQNSAKEYKNLYEGMLKRFNG